MRIWTDKKTGQLMITTNIYQARSGAIMINWGNGTIILKEEDAEKIVYDLEDFSIDDYRNYYNGNKQ
jgi:hypothetical protein